jgi:hypothetical protein
MILWLAIGSAAATVAYAQDISPIPPQTAVRLSDIIAKVEKRPGFQYIERVQWFNDAYIITFHTMDKARVEIHFDALTGQPK